MSSRGRLNLPNIITIARIAICPVLFLLVVAPDTGTRYGAFAVFVLAALSDVWDGHLARKHGWITDTGKLLDPLADKLLLVAVFVPFYIVSHRTGDINHVPYWGPLPAWVLVVIFGREAFMTVFRQWAQQRGVVIAAGRSGKAKTLVQSIFMAALLFWYPFVSTAVGRGWTESEWWDPLAVGVGAVIAGTFVVALVLTVYSMIDYLWSYRALVGVRD